jgi:hypothetical protein
MLFFGNYCVILFSAQTHKPLPCCYCRAALLPSHCVFAVNSYAAALKAYGDVGRRISAAISKQQLRKAAPAAAAADVVRVQDQGVGGVVAQVTCAPSADVQVDHHLLAAAIQTQVGF